MTSRVMVSLRVAATPERAFEAFAEQIGIWWRPNPLFRFTPRSPGTLALEPGLGGRFTETSADGEAFEDRSRHRMGTEHPSRLYLAAGKFHARADHRGRGAVRAVRWRDPDHRRTSRLGHGSPGACRSPYLPRPHFPSSAWGMVANPSGILPALPFRRRRACWRKA